MGKKRHTAEEIINKLRQIGHSSVTERMVGNEEADLQNRRNRGHAKNLQHNA